MTLRCSCATTTWSSLRYWLSTLEVLHPGIVRGTLPLGCSGACRVSALLAMAGFGRWLLRPSPPLPSAERMQVVASSVIEPVLRDASTVRFLTVQAVDVRALFFPPLVCFDRFVTSDCEIVAACSVFGVLVGDGMPVRDALTAAIELA